MENLAVITALYHSGSFQNHSLGLKKNKNVIHQPRSVRIGKNCALCLVYRPRPYPRPRAQFFPIRTSRLVNNIYIWHLKLPLPKRKFTIAYHNYKILLI